MATSEQTEAWQELLVDLDSGDRSVTADDARKAIRADRTLDGVMVPVACAGGVVASVTLRSEVLAYVDHVAAAIRLRDAGDVDGANACERIQQRIYRNLPADWRW